MDSENSDVFSVTNLGIRPGNSNDILLLNNCTVIIYRKGLDEQVQKEITNNYRDNAGTEIERRNPLFAVVLDQELNVLSRDVLFPFASYYPNVINHNNGIVSLKNPDLFDVEENVLTL